MDSSHFAQENSPHDAAGQLAAVARALGAAHKILVDEVRRDYEREHGTVAGPGALLELLLTEPAFAWLRPISRIMAEVDALLDESEQIDSIRIAGLLERLEGVTASARYLDLLQRSPAAVMAHATLRRALIELARR